MFTRKDILLVLLFFNIVCFSQTEFITTWETTSPSEPITIPTTGGGYNYNVNWGDGSPNDTGVTGSVSHVYAVAGTYTVTITGTFNRIYFNNNATNAPKIQSIEQWGSTRVWTNMSNAFYGCTNIVNNATDIPILTSVTSMRRMFRDATAIGTGSATNWNSWNVSNITNMQQLFFGTSFNNDIGAWNVSNVSNFNGMFQNVTVFNQNISGWITTSATNMSSMFREASSFNQNISGWNTSSVTSLGGMFRGATAFNQNIGGWNTASVNSMSRVFQNATNFNQNISGWNTGMVTTMAFMFQNATNFNQNINGWNVALVTNMDEMFRNASSFNQDLNSWNVSNVINMNEMFRGATVFNGNISSWVTSSVTTMSNMFYDATAFNQNIGGWNTANVTTMASMFRDAEAFNQDIDGWNTSAVVSMNSMFRETIAFNQDLNSWNTSLVENFRDTFRDATAFNGDISSWNTGAATTMREMFRGASSFNQDISGWNTAGVTTMLRMFQSASSFDQNIGGWNVENVTSFTSMFNGGKLSVANYNALLVGWDSQNLQPGENFHGGNSKYCSPAAIAARANMIASDGWSITDGGLLTSFVWTGTTDTDWNDNTNWQDGYDADCTLDVSIPVVTNYPTIDASSEFTVDNLTIDSGASLTIEGGLTVEGNLTTNDGLTLNSGGSIIVNGTSTGDLTYNRTIATSNEWYYVSNPFQGETIEHYIANNALNTGNGNVGLFYYDNNTTSGFLGSGFIFYQPSSTGFFVDARGYGTQLSAAGDITFTGTMPTSDASIAISEGTMGDISPNSDNLIGNPFPSYVAGNSNADASNLLTNNTSILSEETMWFWNNTISNYVAINNGSPAFYVAPGQGFFVSSTSSGGTFNILESLQNHQTTDVFYKNNTEPFRIKLNVKNGNNQSKFTEIYFIEGTTNQFDNGYDSSNFNDNDNLDLYSRLVSNENSKNLSIQSLPNKDFNAVVIPLGIVANGKITLNLSTVNQPQEINIYLEDRENNTFTKLTDTSSLDLNLSTSVSGVGRFYLHTKSKSLNTNAILAKGYDVYLDHKQLVINDPFDGKNTLNIFNILGKKVLSKKNVKSSRINLKPLKKGIYFIKLKTEKGIINKKVLLE